MLLNTDARINRAEGEKGFLFDSAGLHPVSVPECKSRFSCLCLRLSQGDDQSLNHARVRPLESSFKYLHKYGRVISVNLSESDSYLGADEGIGMVQEHHQSRGRSARTTSQLGNRGRRTCCHMW